MYFAEEAKTLELVDVATTSEGLLAEATRVAVELGKKPAPAFASIKSLLRKSIVEEMRRKEKESIKEFIEIWYSDSTWENLKNIKIY
jgi:enoyl-CoA hydratase/carnithine racemase